MISVGRVSARARAIFPGWWIVIGSLAILTLQTALFQQAYGTYVAVLQRQFGWSKTALSLAFAFQSIESGLLGPIQGWMIDRFGPRTVLRIGMVIFGLGFMLFSQVDSLATFYVVFVLTAIGASLSGFLSLTTSIVHWFERKRTTAMAITQTGMSIGGLTLPLIAWSIESQGWRWTAFASGIVIMVVGLPLTFLVKSRPEDYGYLPDGVRPGEDLAERAEAREVKVRIASPLPDFTPRQAMRTRAFWFLSIGHAAALLVVGAVQVHLVLYLTSDLDFSLRGATGVVALMTAIMIPGRLVGGVMGDRFEKRFVATIAMSGHSIGLLALAFAESLLLVVVFALLHGLAWGIRGPLMQSLRADYFGRTSFATIMGLSSMIVMVGQMSGPLIAGALADQFGNYQIGFTVLAILSGLGSIFFLLAPRPTGRPGSPS